MRGRRKTFVVRLGLIIAVIGAALGVAAASGTGPAASPPGEVGALQAPAASGALPAAAKGPAGAARTDIAGPYVRLPTNFDVSGPLRDAPSALPAGPLRLGFTFEPASTGAQPDASPFADPVVQRAAGPLVTPAPLLTFEGLDNDDNAALKGGFVFLPPDTTGDVGPNHYVEFVNQTWAVFSKTGVPAAGFPKANNAIWAGFSNATCRDLPRGDPIVIYDQLADRWFLTEFAFTVAGGFADDPFTQCIAVSTTGDPTGTYNRYAYVFPTNSFNDYGKFGLWPDAYYASYNMFTMPAGSFAGTTVAAYDRAAMIAGSPTAAEITFTTPEGSYLPSDLDGVLLPPAGSENFFMRRADFGGSGSDVLRLFKFHVDFGVPANSTFTGPTNISVADFDSVFSADVPQPGTAQRLDVLSDRLMQRLAYRKFSTHESLVVNHTADVGTDHAGVRWYEVRDPDGTPTVHQQATWAPDADNRWMGSAAMDCNGNLAVGYSLSSAATSPSIRYAGRLATDPLSTLQAEATLQAGAGSQLPGLFGDASRWGDYSAMQVDPSDDKTFWYTNEYYNPSSNYRWRTRIGSFRLTDDPCSTPTAVNVAAFKARFGKAGVTASWRTSSEAQVAGFNLWRTNKANGAWRKVNRALIAAKHAGQTRGASYRFVDRTAKPGRFYNYRLQVVDLKGVRAWYGIGSAATR